MTNRKQQILALITRQPGLRDVEIANALDMDLDHVRLEVSMAVSNNEVLVKKGIVCGGFKVSYYRINPAYEEWKSPAGAGKPPSYDELEQALEAALEQRRVLESIARDMGNILSQCVAAHLKNDAAGVKSVLEAFAKHVRVVDHTNQSGSMH
ncbi:MAG: hypothetical protein GZ090_01555 [Oxalobacteraceae bacterium]|nr:hypothetical protein [Oxalobacteraceae bacterium]